MVLDETAELGDALDAILAIARRGGEPDRVDAPRVERRDVAAVRVVEIGPAAGHAGPEVRPDWAEDHDDAAGHVLAAVLAEALDDRLGAGVADGESHPGP